MVREVHESRYLWIGIGVSAVALLGWMLALYFWSASAEAEGALERAQSLTGTASQLETRIVALRSEAALAETERDHGMNELEQLEQRLEDVREQVATLDADAQAIRAEREALETELVAGRNERTSLEEGVEQARQAVAETSQEFSDVGERLEQARRREADLQSSLADLTVDVSQLTDDALGAEERVQAAREAEASLEQRVVAARQTLDEMQNTHDAVEQSVAALIQRREELSTDTVAAEEQMQAIQDVVLGLTQSLDERSEHLSDLEARIADMQRQAGQAGRAAAAGLVPGERYVHGSVTASFDPGGTFLMEHTRTGEAVNGFFSISEGVLTLSEAEGDLRKAEFPMRCAISPDEAGFTLADKDGQCALLAGVSFDRMRP